MSSIDRYKAQMEVVRAYGILKAQCKKLPKLVLVGPVNDAKYERDVRAEVRRLGLCANVVLAGPVPYSELPATYQHASLHIFASESENCPNILLEAMASGKPVLSSMIAPMPEFGTDAVEYFDPRDPHDLAEKIETLLGSPVRMAELARRAELRARDFDWTVTAKRTRDALAALVAESSLKEDR